MDEKWRLPLWAAAATKDMEFAVTQRSANPFVEEGLTFFDKLNTRTSVRVFFCFAGGPGLYPRYLPALLLTG